MSAARLIDSSSFSLSDKIDEACYLDIETPNSNGNYFNALISSSVLNEEMSYKALLRAIETVLSSDLYDEGGGELMPYWMLSVLKSADSRGLDSNKICENLGFRVFPISYRKLGNSEAMFAFFSRINADLFKGVLLFCQNFKERSIGLQNSYLKGVLSGANQLAIRLEFEEEDYLIPMLQELILEVRLTATSNSSKSFSDFVEILSEEIFSAFEGSSTQPEVILDLINRSIAENTSYHTIETGNNIELYASQISGITNAILKKIAVEQSASTEGIVIASFVGNIGVMNKNNRQFLPKKQIHSGIELMGDFTFLTSQYSSAVLILKNNALIQLSEETQVQVDYDGDEVHVHIDYGNLFFDSSRVSSGTPLILRSNTGFVQLVDSIGEFSLVLHHNTSNSSGVLKMLSGEGLYKGNNGRFVPVKKRENVHLVIDDKGNQLVSADVFPMSTMEQRSIDDFTNRTKNIVQRVQYSKSEGIKNFRNNRGRVLEKEVSSKIIREEELKENKIKSLLVPVGGQIMNSMIESNFLLNQSPEFVKSSLKIIVGSSFRNLLSVPVEDSFKLELLADATEQFVINVVEHAFVTKRNRQSEILVSLATSVLEEITVISKEQGLSNFVILSLIKNRLVKSILVEAGIYRRQLEPIKLSLNQSFQQTLDSLPSRGIELPNTDKKLLLEPVD